MSMETIYGGWSKSQKRACSRHGDLDWLWGCLSNQPETNEPNFGLSQRKNEIFELWKLFQTQNPQIVVEIGVAQGGSFAAWCMLMRQDGMLIGIDRDTNDCRPRPGDPGNSKIYDGKLAMTSEGGGLYSLIQYPQAGYAINGWSHEPEVMEKLLGALNSRKIDFLFHDASHSAEMFARDFELYWPLVAEGGLFASHDINWSADPKCDKRTAWEEIKRTATYSACYEYLPHPSVSEMGIGVLIK